MSDTKLSRRGLEPKVLKQLAILDESMIVLRAMVIFYDKDKIDTKLSRIDSKIKDLTNERQEVVEKQLNVCTAKTAEYETRIEENLSEQSKVIMGRKNLVSLANLLAQIEILTAKAAEMEAVV